MAQQEQEKVDILLVEDNADETELALRALRKGDRHPNTFVVEDGAQALDFLFARGEFAHRAMEAPPRLVLLDLMLPKVNGLEVLRRARANDKTRTIPVVMLSSSREDRDIVESYQGGANSYIVKPLNFEMFVRCISTVRDYWLECNRLPT
jgi:CheY-like chemotaxis protein